MQQVLFRIPFVNWPVFGFGLMLFLAFVSCTWLAGRRAKREGVNPDSIQDLALYLFLGGLLGARITFIMQNPPKSFLDFLYQLPRIWDGGIILYGSVLGALAAYVVAWWFLFRKQNVSTFKVMDIIAPSVALGLCLGRIGCFLNGCCYGHVVTADCPACAVHFPLSAPARYDLVEHGYQTAIGFTFAEDQPLGRPTVVGIVEKGSPAWEAGLRPGDVLVAVDGSKERATPDKLNEYLGLGEQGWPKGKRELRLTVKRTEDDPERTLVFAPTTLGLHPTQLYESISMILLFLLLLAYAPLKTRDGQVMALLMMCYAVHRYVNEKLRSDPRPIEFESISSIILFAGGLLMMVYLLLRPAQYNTQWSTSPRTERTQAPVPKSSEVAIKKA
jgi:prolipoprotein diacylglyceryltransferase